AHATADGLRQVQSRPQPEDFVSRLVLGYEVDSAGYRYRQAVRDQQRVIFNISSQPGLSDQVEQVAPPALAPVLHNAAGAYHAMWSLAGIDEYNLLRLHLHPLAGAEAVDTLRGYYVGAASQYQIDWSYLASINYIESDFAPVTGPTSAGALRPMQFMPSTWDAGPLGAAALLGSVAGVLAALGRWGSWYRPVATPIRYGPLVAIPFGAGCLVEAVTVLLPLPTAARQLVVVVLFVCLLLSGVLFLRF